ncbi:MAG: YceI family protein, partial [Vulcanimicrobiaceae bacterium]
GDRDRDTALRGPDWFDSEHFPLWTFASTSIAPTPTGFTMNGTLTIHGVARPEHLDVTIEGPADRPINHATGRVDRHSFGMRLVRLDPVIGNPVDIQLYVTLKPPRI